MVGLALSFVFSESGLEAGLKKDIKLSCLSLDEELAEPFFTAAEPDLNGVEGLRTFDMACCELS